MLLLRCHDMYVFDTCYLIIWLLQELPPKISVGRFIYPPNFGDIYPKPKSISRFT